MSRPRRATGSVALASAVTRRDLQASCHRQSPWLDRSEGARPVIEAELTLRQTTRAMTPARMVSTIRASTVGLSSARMR